MGDDCSTVASSSSSRAASPDSHKSFQVPQGQQTCALPIDLVVSRWAGKSQDFGHSIIEKAPSNVRNIAS